MTTTTPSRHAWYRRALTVAVIFLFCVIAFEGLCLGINTYGKSNRPENTGLMNSSQVHVRLSLYPKHLETYIGEQLFGYAWGENIGWISFGPSAHHTGVGIDLTTGNLSGYAWGENTGWISFGPSAHHTGVGIDLTTGNLSGYAWGENIGWINFGPSTHHTGVKINLATGNFSGYAWGENIGWINFEGISVLQWTEILFNWMEIRYPEILTPSPQPTLENNGIFYRFYPDTDVAIGIIENNLFFLDQAGILYDLGEVDFWVSFAVSDIVFNRLETLYPGILAPSPQPTLENNGIFYRYYPDTDVAIGTIENNLFFLDQLGILHNLGSLNDWFHHVERF